MKVKKTMTVVETVTYYVDVVKQVKDESEIDDIDWEEEALTIAADQNTHQNEYNDKFVVEGDEEIT